MSDNLRQARVTAQLLHRPKITVDNVVRHMLAVQAQDINALPLAIRARSGTATRAALQRARAARSVVRAWGPRGTLHLIAADDLPWLWQLVGHRGRTQAMRRLAQEGIAGAEADLVRLTARALAGQGPLTKAELGARLAGLGQPAQGQGIVYLAFLGATHGQVVLGPDRGAKPTYVHAEDWLGAPLRPALEPDQALAELARRYLRSRGPAEPADLAAWSGVSIREAQAAFGAISGELASFPDTPLWHLRGRRSRPVPPVALLPAFDEYLLSWRSRDLVLDPARAKRVIPGGGMFRPVVLGAGRVAGSWRPDGAVDLFEEVDDDALAAELADVQHFLQAT